MSEESWFDHDKLEVYFAWPRASQRGGKCGSRIRIKSKRRARAISLLGDGSPCHNRTKQQGLGDLPRGRLRGDNRGGIDVIDFVAIGENHFEFPKLSVGVH